MPLTYVFRIVLEAEFRSCGIPTGRDAHLLECIAGLDSQTYSENATLTLAQTVIYEGETGIQEYQAITDAGPDDLLQFSFCRTGSNTELLIHDVSDKQCNITIGFVSTMGATTNPRFDTSNVSQVDPLPREMSTANRLLYHLASNGSAMIDESHLFLGNPFHNVFPDVDQSTRANFICDTLFNHCSSEQQSFPDFNACVSDMKSLPSVEVNSHGYFSSTGNSTSCRTIHAGLARKNPEAHCPHISWYSEEDTSGRYKCDDKSLDKVFFNFTDEEWSLFRRVAIVEHIEDPSFSRELETQQVAPCVVPSTEDILARLDDLGEFEHVNIHCLGYLDASDAQPEYIGTYWAILAGMAVTFRVLQTFLLFRQSKSDI